MSEAFEEHRRTLFGIAYRMLGSVADAEDMVQEVWLRWHRSDRATIVSTKAWLVAAMTRLCIDQLRSARRTREEYYGVWLPDPLAAASGPAPEEEAGLADSLSMAFMLMLETLDPVERATFLLREVFDLPYADTAAIVGKSEVNCRQIVRRARAQFDGKQTTAQLPNAQAHQLVDEFLAASQSGDVKTLLEMLVADATVYSDGGGRVKAAGRPIVSADHVSRFFTGIATRLPAGMEWRAAEINGRSGRLMYAQGELFGACSFDFVEGRVHRVYMILNPEKLRHLPTGL